MKITAGTCSICLFILALMYPVVSVGHEDKKHFLLSPKAVGVFYPPLGNEADWMMVWAAVFKDTSFGSFKMVMYGYESYEFDSNGNVIKTLDELHWYTDNLRAAQIYARLPEIVYPTYYGIPNEWEYDVTLARIDITISEHELDATVTMRNEVFFTVNFNADTNAPMQTRIEPGSPLPQDLYLSVEAYRTLLSVSVTGLEVGAYSDGRFTYVDTELIDSSLLP